MAKNHRVTDEEIAEGHLQAVMIVLADIVSPECAKRLRFGHKHDAIIREAVVQHAEFDLVKLARFVLAVAKKGRCSIVDIINKAGSDDAI